MEKKAYIIPGIDVMTVELPPIMDFSGGGDKSGDPIVNPNADDSNDPNRSRNIYDAWGED